MHKRKFVVYRKGWRELKKNSLGVKFPATRPAAKIGRSYQYGPITDGIKLPSYNVRFAQGVQYDKSDTV